MIVQRFINWLRVTLVASLGGARQRSVEQSVREPVLAGVSAQTNRSEPGSASLSLSNWLDNGRRLRLTRAPRETVSNAGTGTSAGMAARPLWFKAHPTAAPTPPAPTETSAPRVQCAPVAAEPVKANPEPVPTVPAVPAAHTEDDFGDDLSNLEHLDADTRRLMLLRHLVRRRIFNEGFTGKDVPSQYRRSHGLDASPPQC